MRTRRRTTYSIARLLARQPKALARHPHYEAMMAHLRASPRLRSLRLERRCYTLLNNARIAPENLRHFYRTYALPANPFFPLFFEIKRAYLRERDARAEARRTEIRALVRELPAPIVDRIRYLGYLERAYNGAAKSPEWQRIVYPRSMKLAREYHSYSEAQWLARHAEYLNALCVRYRAFTGHDAEIIRSSFTLGIIPSTIPPTRPDAHAVAAAYRRLSMLHHPDRGGDAAMFIEIKRARDALAGPTGRSRRLAKASA